MTPRGTALERLVAASARAQAAAGLRLEQSSPRVSHRGVGAGGKLRAARVLGAGGLDFSGDLRGRAVMLDAKEVATPTRFDLKNLKRHQVTIVKNAHERGTVAFFLVSLLLRSGEQDRRFFALDWPTLAPFWRPFDAVVPVPGAPSSIPLAAFEAACVEVRLVRGRLDLAGAIYALQQRLDGASILQEVPHA